MDVNEPIQIALKLPKSDQRQPGSQQATDNDAIFRSRTNMPSQTESAERYELLQPFYNHTEGKHLTTEELLWKEACDISCNLLPLDHYYTTSRAPLNRSGVVNRAFYDIIVNITRTDQATKGQCKRRPRGGGETSKSDDRTGLSGVGGVGMMFAEGFFIIVIAGLHALAWNFTFPTPLERLLWRLSCVGMAVFPMAVIVCAAKNSYHIDLVKVLWNHSTVGCHGWDYLPQSLVYLCEIAEVSALPGYRHPSTSSCLTTTTQETKSMDAEAQITTEKPVGGGASWGKILLHICLLTLCILLLAGYLVSILFITVEGYISLRTLPDSAFMTPRWTDYWPHV
ncbi:hypothetical protein BZA05DRAFT_254531 [Tricharina praecox]|uniref:uncharacterized protein n=1 Tax=Tricharina praecox TaxID=43433 RepID=UPI00221F87E0|nr:uncharacterized protein BZA05DRAFT_254531 [Tricharina praecox]KAI5854968.1 hypothetical protein BZA05DRAFT_254531 [Tricharina praecox]